MLVCCRGSGWIWQGSLLFSFWPWRDPPNFSFRPMITNAHWEAWFRTWEFGFHCTLRAIFPLFFRTFSLMSALRAEEQELEHCNNCQSVCYANLLAHHLRSLQDDSLTFAYRSRWFSTLCSTLCGLDLSSHLWSAGKSQGNPRLPSWLADRHYALIWWLLYDCKDARSWSYESEGSSNPWTG